MKFYSVFKRKLYSMLVSPILYVVMVIFLALSGYFFYTDLVAFNWMDIAGTTSLARGLWQFYFLDVRYLLIFLLPLITMRTIAEEKKLGTIELITTCPIRDIEILIGEILACLAVFVLMLFSALWNAIVLGRILGFSELGPFLAGFLGLFLLGCSMISTGVFVSTLTESQTVAAAGTWGVFILFWFLTWNELIAEGKVIRILLRFSLFDRTMSFFKGVLDTSDLLYFILFAVFSGYLSWECLRQRMWRRLR